MSKDDLVFKIDSIEVNDVDFDICELCNEGDELDLEGIKSLISQCEEAFDGWCDYSTEDFGEVSINIYNPDYSDVNEAYTLYLRVSVYAEVVEKALDSI